MFKWRIGIKAVNRPYTLRSIDSLMSSGILNFKEPWRVEIFNGSIDASYLKPVREKYPQIVIHHDGQKHLCYPNSVRAFQTIKNDTKYSLIVPDDIIYCRNFLQYCNWFLTKFSQFKVWSFWTPYREVEDAYKKGQQMWLWPIAKFYGGVLSLLPSVINDYLIMTARDTNIHISSLAERNTNIHVGLPPDRCCDMRLKRYFMKRGINICASVPNVVQHIGLQSTLGKRPERIACCFIGESKTPKFP